MSGGILGGAPTRDAAIVLRLAADCFACGAVLQLPSEAELAHEFASAALDELPPEQAARLRAALADPADHRAVAQLLDRMAAELEPPPKPARPRRPRKTMLAMVLKQAARVGVTVARVEMDGVTLVLGETTAGEKQGNELDQWIAKHHAH